MTVNAEYFFSFIVIVWNVTQIADSWLTHLVRTAYGQIPYGVRTKCHGTKCHSTKCHGPNPPDKMPRGKLTAGQNATMLKYSIWSADQRNLQVFIFSQSVFYVSITDIINTVRFTIHNCLYRPTCVVFVTTKTLNKNIKISSYINVPR